MERMMRSAIAVQPRRDDNESLLLEYYRAMPPDMQAWLLRCFRAQVLYGETAQAGRA